MADLNYKPNFHHDSWVDNVDRVQAGGDNGFNIRFTTIEDDLNRVGQVVQEINNAINSLGQQVTAQVEVGLTPILLPMGANPPWSAIIWSRNTLGTFVEKPSAQDQAHGVLPLNLSIGVRLISLKVMGEHLGDGEVITELVQESRTAPFARTALVTVTGLSGPPVPPTPIAGEPIFEGAANVYYLYTKVDGASGSTTRFRGYQLIYQP